MRDTTAIHLSSLAFYNGNIWFSFKKSDGTYRLYTFNVSTKRWTGPHILSDSSGNEMEVHSMHVASGDPGTSEVGTRSSHLYFLTLQGTQAGVYELIESAVVDSGATAIDLDVHTKVHDFGSPHEEKLLRHGEIEYKKVTGTSGTFTVQVRKDWGDWKTVATIDYTKGNTVDRNRFSLNSLGRGRQFQFRIRCTDTNTQPEIIRLVINGYGFNQKQQNF